MKKTKGEVMNLIQEIKKFFLDKKFIKSLQDLDNEDSLLEKGVIDSVAMLELVSFLEKKYEIKVEDDELMPENFDTLKSIEEYIKGKLQ